MNRSIMLACSLLGSQYLYSMNQSATHQLPYYSGYRLRALICAEDPGVQHPVTDTHTIQQLCEACPTIRPELGWVETPDHEFGATFVTHNGMIQACLLMIKEHKVRILDESTFSLDAHPTAHFIARRTVYDLVIRCGPRESWYTTKPEDESTL